MSVLVLRCPTLYVLLHCSNTFDSNEWRVIRLGHLFEMRCVEVGTNLKHASPRTQNLTHLTEVTISLSYLQSEGPAGFTLSHNQQGCMSRLIFKQNRLQYCLQSYVWMHFGLNFDTLLAYKSREHTVMKLEMYIFFFILNDCCNAMIWTISIQNQLRKFDREPKFKIL